MTNRRNNDYQKQGIKKDAKRTWKTIHTNDVC